MIIIIRPPSRGAPYTAQDTPNVCVLLAAAAWARTATDGDGDEARRATTTATGTRLREHSAHVF